MNSSQVLLEIDGTHIGSGLVAAHHMANWAIMSPWESISELPQTVLGESDETVFGFLKGVVGDEAASGTSCHCRDLQRLA